MTKSELIKNALLIASHTQNNPEYEELLKRFDDFVLVPREPTFKMSVAYEKNSIAPISSLSVRGYKAMIEAQEKTIPDFSGTITAKPDLSDITQEQVG